MGRAVYLTKKQLADIRSLDSCDVFKFMPVDASEPLPPIFRDLIRDYWSLVRRLRVHADKHREYRSPREAQRAADIANVELRG